MTYIIAIDGGGTSTKCAIADEAGIIAMHDAQNAKPNVVGFEHSSRILFDALLNTCLEGDVPFNRVKSIVIGMSGVWDADECESLRAMLFHAANAQMYALPRTDIVSDAAIALNGAFVDSRGVLVISGTGSIAVGKTSDGCMHRVGGYGALLGDEGSGSWIGKRALSHVLRTCDGRSKPGLLTKLVAEHMGLKLPDEVRRLAAVVNAGSVHIADVAPVVFSCAEQNDRASLNIISDASEKLVELAIALSRRIEQEHFDVCFMGGIAEHPLMKRRIKRKIGELPQMNYCEAKATALEGAVMMARSGLNSLLERSSTQI